MTTTVHNKRPRGDARRTDRIVLDVGGQEFVTSRSTLKNNATYFDSLLSEEWDNGRAEQVFLDQDPEAFKILLAYMRMGMMDTVDVSKEVLLLADFLGIDKLIRAVKVKCCSNGDHSCDEEAISQFDEKYVTIRTFVESGALSLFAISSESNRECAVIRTDYAGRCRIECKELNSTIDSIVGALNALHYLGYNEESVGLRYSVRDEDGEHRFFRSAKKNQREESVANLLIDSITQQPQKKKMFACVGLCGYGNEEGLPAEFPGSGILLWSPAGDETKPLAERQWVQETGCRHGRLAVEGDGDNRQQPTFMDHLMQHGYLTREWEMEKTFFKEMKALVANMYKVRDCRMFSKEY